MLRLVQTGGCLPLDWPVDPNAEFQPGMIGQLGVTGNNIVCGVSDGTAPLGIIDDIKTQAFFAPAINEAVIVSPPAVAGPGNTIISAVDAIKEMKNSNIMSASFTSSIDVELIPLNGVLNFIAGTELNFDLDGDGIPDSIRTVVSYSYQVPGIPGDDTTLSSGKVTIWFGRIIAQTDQFETNQQYPVSHNLFVSENGVLTSRQPSENHVSVAIVTGPPTSIASSLEFMWL